MNPSFSEHANHLENLIDCALDAADPGRILSDALSCRSNVLCIRDRQVDLDPTGRILVLSVGKAASPMALTTVRLLKSKPETVIVVRPKYDPVDLPSGWLDFPAGHPLPDRTSLAAGRAVQSAVQRLREQDLLLLLLSGGGSALLELPKPGVRYKDLMQINQDLLRSGAPIEQINKVRKSLSLIKGGGLARLAAPARILTLILSDVVGDDLSVIASGPTVLEEPNPESTIEILKAHGLWSRYSKHLGDGIRLRPSTPRSTGRIDNLLLANNLTVINAVAVNAASIGFEVKLVESPFRGEARQAGRAFGNQVYELPAASTGRSQCLVGGGETTVTVSGQGRGGRNQEFALAAAMALNATPRSAILSLATDGIDGPTDAAGANVTVGMIETIRARGLDAEHHLEQNDVYPLLEHLNALIFTGPTQTNLNDIAVGFRYEQN